MTHIRDVLDVEDRVALKLVALKLQPPNDNVKGDVCSGVTQMSPIINCGSANIHPDMLISPWLKLLHLFAHRVENP